MGLDVSLIKIVKESESLIPLEKGVHRLDYLFDRFKDFVITKPVEYFDTDDWSNSTVVYWSELPSHLQQLVPENELNAYKTVLVRSFDIDSEFNEIIDSIITHKVVTVEEKYLPFEEIEYICRKSHNQNLYNKFLGTCWYDGDDCSLDPLDQRMIVLKNEFKELKECFNSDSPLQSFDFNDDNTFILLDY